MSETTGKPMLCQDVSIILWSEQCSFLCVCFFQLHQGINNRPLKKFFLTQAEKKCCTRKKLPETASFFQLHLFRILLNSDNQTTTS